MRDALRAVSSLADRSPASRSSPSRAASALERNHPQRRRTMRHPWKATAILMALMFSTSTAHAQKGGSTGGGASGGGGGGTASGGGGGGTSTNPLKGVNTYSFAMAGTPLLPD